METVRVQHDNIYSGAAIIIIIFPVLHENDKQLFPQPELESKIKKKLKNGLDAGHDAAVN